MNTVNFIPRKSDNTISIVTKMIAAFCFLGAVNFVNGSYYWFFISIILLFLFEKITIPANLSMALLMLFAVEIVAFKNHSAFSLTEIAKPFLFLICYVLGYNLLGFASNNKARSNSVFVQWIIGILSMGCFIHYILNWITNLNALSRNTVDFWTGSILSATGQITFACFPLAVASTYLLSDSKATKKCIALLIMACLLGYNMILAGRTLLAMTLLVFFAAYVFYAVTNQSGHKLQLSFLVMILLFVLIILYDIDFLNIKTIIEDSILYRRFFDKNTFNEIFDDGRLAFKGQYIKLIFKYPFGGNKIHAIVGNYAHDLYLDTCDEIGVLGLITIMMVVITSIRNMIRFVLDKTIEFELRQLVFCTYLVSNLEFWIEPILAGVPWFLAMYCMIDGAVARCLSTNGGQNFENSGN